jgi:serine/threonine protein kinase
MDFLESKRVVHRDLATRNVLLKTKHHCACTHTLRLVSQLCAGALLWSDSVFGRVRTRISSSHGPDPAHPLQVKSPTLVFRERCEPMKTTTRAPRGGNGRSNGATSPRVRTPSTRSHSAAADVISGFRYAPESVNYGKFTAKSDVFSFGVTMWEIYSQAREPWGDLSMSEVGSSCASDRDFMPAPCSCPIRRTTPISHTIPI